MKKILLQIVSILLVVVVCLTANMSALAENSATPDWQDANWTQEEFEAVLAENPNNQVSLAATGLIMSYLLAVSKSGTTLNVAGQTLGATTVVKAGFTVITIQRRTSSSASWTTYKTYEDLYSDSHSYTIGKTLSVASGYQYRATCTHYAKKNIFSTQKINNTSNIVSI